MRIKQAGKMDYLGREEFDFPSDPYSRANLFHFRRIRMSEFRVSGSFLPSLWARRVPNGCRWRGTDKSCVSRQKTDFLFLGGPPYMPQIRHITAAFGARPLACTTRRWLQHPAVTPEVGSAFQRQTVHVGQGRAATFHDDPLAQVAQRLRLARIQRIRKPSALR